MWFNRYPLLLRPGMECVYWIQMYKPSIHLLRNHLINRNGSNVNFGTKDCQAVIA